MIKNKNLDLPSINGDDTADNKTDNGLDQVINTAKENSTKKLIDNTEATSDTKPFTKSLNTTSSKQLYILIAVAVFLLLLVIAGYNYVFMPSDQTTNSTGTDTSIKNQEFPSDNINSQLADLPKSKPSITPTPTPTVTQTPSPSPTDSKMSAPEISIAKPSISKTDTDTTYTYSLKLNDSAVEIYKKGMKLKIDAENCEEDFYTGSTDFDDTLSSAKSTTDYKVSIKTGTISKESNSSNYEITDVNGDHKLTGKITAPLCKISNESNSNGKFSMKLTETNSSLVEDNIHFEWDFTMDSKAKSLLEKGFTHKINASSCKEALEDEEDGYDGYFNTTWNAGVLDKIGLAVNIENEYLPTDSKKWTKLSTYQILNNNGQKVFEGFVDVPNCN